MGMVGVGATSVCTLEVPTKFEQSNLHMGKVFDIIHNYSTTECAEFASKCSKFICGSTLTPVIATEEGLRIGWSYLTIRT